MWPPGPCHEANKIQHILLLLYIISIIIIIRIIQQGSIEKIGLTEMAIEPFTDLRRISLIILKSRRLLSHLRLNHF